MLNKKKVWALPNGGCTIYLTFTYLQAQHTRTNRAGGSMGTGVGLSTLKVEKADCRRALRWYFQFRALVFAHLLDMGYFVLYVG